MITIPLVHLRDDDVNRSVSLVSSVPRVREFSALTCVITPGMQCCHGRPRYRLGCFSGYTFQILYRCLAGCPPATAAGRGQRDEITSRDRIDSSRAASPLVVAPDAAVIDTSSLTIDGVVDRIIQR